LGDFFLKKERKWSKKKKGEMHQQQYHDDIDGEEENWNDEWFGQDEPFHSWSCLYEELFSLSNTGTAVETIHKTFEVTMEFVLRHYGSKFNENDMKHATMIRDRGNTGIKLAFILGTLAHEGALRDVVTRGIKWGYDSIAAVSSEQPPLSMTDGVDILSPPSSADIPITPDSHITTVLGKEAINDNGETPPEIIGDYDVIENDRSGVECALKSLLYYRVLAIATRGLIETPFTEKNAADFLISFIEICFLGWKCLDSHSMMPFCDFFSARCKPEEDFRWSLLKENEVIDRENSFSRDRIYTEEDIRLDRKRAAEEFTGNVCQIKEQKPVVVRSLSVCSPRKNEERPIKMRRMGGPIGNTSTTTITSPFSATYSSPAPLM
jgi:hypothetical protein